MMKRRLFLRSLLTTCLALAMPWRWSARAGLTRRDEVVKPGARAVSRVLRVHDPAACRWDFGPGDYTTGIDSAAVRRMLAAGLTALTGAADAASAWRALIPQRQGDRIVIKPNLGNIHVGYGEVIMTSPQLLAALVASLLEAGFPAESITVFDLTAPESDVMRQWLGPFGVRTVFMKRSSNLFDKLTARVFPGPAAADRGAPVVMRNPVRDKHGAEVECFMPEILTEADHLINVPVLKGHQYLLQSSALKNHFGTVRFSNRNAYPVVLHGEYLESHIVDLNDNPHIRDKTRLCVVDALLGAACFTLGDNDRRPSPWTSPGLDRVPGSLFFSRDPVALESVIGDLVAAEQRANGFEPLSHRYLHEAAQRGLGVHEHRDGTGGYENIDFRALVMGAV
ncbi:DUF362 domain-containing protein [Geothermobacter hydrogeniphilus]|uniref:DUF362 domain-containing protein n=1 Tax=Geothermobacter hydrogeniphilus TaxID=1969733 RepID=A0A1X0YE81_9BACT|nr:DUF362 domain-containing protein [Geothermobacter hydrogeniphilus]ORJ63393.1 hypothetical protein B5V00_00575 [Geothermobacter hydrogeniphilus]